MEISYKLLIYKAVKDIVYSSTSKVDAVRKIKTTFGISLIVAKALYEEIYPPTEIHTNIEFYSNKPVGVCYNNDDSTITIVMADSIEEAMKVQL